MRVFLLCCVAALVVTAPTDARPLVVIMGIDGMSGRACADSEGFRDILTNASYTLRARTVEHTRSYEAWQAILMGGYDAGTELGFAGTKSDVRHPRLFNHVRSQLPDSVLWYFGDYYVVRKSANDKLANMSQHTATAREAVDAFIGHLEQGATPPPTLTVLYSQDADRAGHRHGWYSPEYNAAIEDAAVQIKRVRAALPANATIFVVSDHGGSGKGHGYTGSSRNMNSLDSDIDAPRFREVPWIRYGGTATPRPLCDTVRVDDTAVEVAHALDIAPHPSWRTRVAWLPEDAPCSHADVAPRLLSVAAQGSVERAWAITAAFIVIMMSL